MKPALTKEFLSKLLSYDPETGHFTWIVGRQCVRAGTRAGHLMPDGYVRIIVAGSGYYAHRLAFIITQGYCPQFVDHINRNKSDNRISNLRGATRSQNKMNMPVRRDSTTGVRGIRYRRDRERYEAYLRVDRRCVYLGTFLDAKSAGEAYARAAKAKFGEFYEGTGSG